MGERLTILIAARDEEERIGSTVTSLRRSFPEAEVVVADDGSLDATAERAEAAGARVVRLPARGKGQALTLAEHTAETGPLLLCDADLRGVAGVRRGDDERVLAGCLRQPVPAMDDDRHVETLRRAPRDQLGAGRRSAHPDEDHELRARERHRRRRAERERGAALGRESGQHLARAMRIDPLESGWIVEHHRRATVSAVSSIRSSSAPTSTGHTSRSAVPW